VKAVLTLLVAGATVGLGLSFFSHVCSLFGLRGLVSGNEDAFFVGMLVLIGPCMVVQFVLTAGARITAQWKALMRGCPQWMRRTFYGLLGYAALNFFGVSLLEPKRTSSGLMTPLVERMITGHLMVFFGALAVIFYSALQVWNGRGNGGEGRSS
jgi:hypothetical protein